jgi:hypothetical protein
MRFPESFSHHTVALMGLACDHAWQRLREQCFYPAEADDAETRNAIAMCVMAAVTEGERDPERLTAIALHAIDADRFPAPATLPTSRE